MDVDSVQFVDKWTFLQIAFEELYIGLLNLLQSGLLLLLALLFGDIWVNFRFWWLFLLFSDRLGLITGGGS